MTNKFTNQDEAYLELKGNFIDLTIRVYGICDANPGIISRLLYELVYARNEFPEGYIPDNKDICSTIDKVEEILDDIETLSQTSIH